MPHDHLNIAYEALVLRILQQSRDNSKNCIVALMSPHRGAGVTQITNILAGALRADRNQRVATVCASELAGPEADPNGHNLAASLDTMRNMYRFVLVDCGSIRHTQNAMRLAPLVDGVILVVEANKTRRDQLLHTEQVIESLDGRILGHVLNKRTYVVPNWLYGLMDAVGM